MTDIKAARRAKEKEAERAQRASGLQISLDPREQSLVYCELEFALTSAINGYVTAQFDAGRLDADKYKKIVDAWQQKGRPRVVGFRYDLETQLDLIHLHLAQFRFYGDRAAVPVAVAGVLDMMRVNARAMRIRTFCQPDSVVAKQLLDSQSLFHLLGCPEPRLVQLSEIVQFFKAALAREKHFRGGATQPDDDDGAAPSSTTRSRSRAPKPEPVDHAGGSEQQQQQPLSPNKK